MKKRKIRKIVLSSIGILIVMAGIFLAIFIYGQWNSKAYPQRTRINGFEAAGKNPEDMQTILTENFEIPTVHIREQEKEILKASLTELGYSIDQDVLLTLLQEAYSRQKTKLTDMLESLISGKAYRITIPFKVDDAAFMAAISAQNISEPRIERKNAELIYNEEEQIYSIAEEQYGTEFADEQLQKLVTGKVEEWMMSDRSQKDIVIDVNDEVYIQPEIKKDDPQLNNLCNVYNQFVKASIVYTFGDQTETLDWNTVKDWMIVGEGTAEIDRDKAAEYISGLAGKYNTIYAPRTFHTSVGTTITIEGPLNEYGYRIDQEQELEQLLADLKGNTRVERAPVYSYSGYYRSGTDDLVGTYVEVNLSTQHLWFYKNGGLVVETDIVSGCVAKKTETQTGVFPLAYKESPSILSGDDAENGWETEVQYWMPFFDGQGLHDATWRNQFGGNIYQNSGSHGCVNLPYAAAEQIFQNIDAGVAIILYQ